MEATVSASSPVLDQGIKALAIGEMALVVGTGGFARCGVLESSTSDRRTS